MHFILRTGSILFLLLSSLYAEALKDIKFKDVEIAKVTSVYDGDTFRVNIKGYPKIIGYRVPVRIRGIDTPELKSKNIQEKKLALKAKQFTVQRFRGAKVIELKNISRGKYFRLIADVYIDNISLGGELLKKNLAVVYYGGAKQNWCEKDNVRY